MKSVLLPGEAKDEVEGSRVSPDGMPSILIGWYSDTHLCHACQPKWLPTTSLLLSLGALPVQEKPRRSQPLENPQRMTLRADRLPFPFSWEG